MAPPKAADSSLEALKSLVGSAAALILQFETTLQGISSGQPAATAPPSSSSPSTSSSAIDSLSLAHDSATLIKAHTTKLSLLIINEPFTPSAIIKVLKELIAGPIPGIVSATQLCEADRYTAVARQDLAWRCHRVLKELRGLVETIPLDGKILSAEKKNGAQGGMGSLTATGVIWSACDDVMLLKTTGIANILIKKVQQYKDTLQDVLDELKEWKEEGEQEEEEEEGGDEGQDEVEYVTNHLDATHLSTQDMLDDLMNTQHIPRDDPDKIKERLESCLKRLRLTTLLYSAIVKRRLKVLPALPASSPTPVAKRVDEVFVILKRITEHFNEVACAFYEMEPDAIDESMDACFFDAFAASEILMKPWDGDRDEFTDWAEKFQVSIKKPD
ncbi:hypothetical protein BX600DRAFT_474507 [Xylariales sp. PMI_506]|nr:hypothetical protein BX600DRAFT_474507 [Xylariales sp. PMI_506]